MAIANEQENTNLTNYPSNQQESIKRVFEVLAELAVEHNVEYRFDTVEAGTTTKKYLYFADKLVGLGTDPSARQAKIKAA